MVGAGMRGIRTTGRPETTSICDRQAAAAGWPRCHNRAGELAIDGRVVPANALACPCPNANTPSATCPYATRAEVEEVEITTGNGWAAPVTESKPACLAALTVPERARIVTVPDNERKPRP
jgi:hypothetical protein